MKLCWNCGLVVVWIAACSVCRADTSPRADQVAAFVQQLAASNQSERAAAVQALESLGPAVLPLLPADGAVDDSAVRDALSKLRKVLEQRLAQDSTQAARVTLSGPTPLDQLLRVVADQTQNQIDWQGAAVAETMYSAKWVRVPFWMAVNDLCRATDRQPRWDRRRGWLLAVPDPQSRELTAAVSGPFRVAIRDLGWKPLPGKAEKLLRVGLAVQLEPRLRPLFLAVRPGDWSAQIGSTKLSAWNESAEYELPFAGNDCEVSWMLDVLAPSDAQIAEAWTLSGKCRVHLAAGTEPFAFEAAQWERGGTIRRGSVTVRLRSAKLTSNESGNQNLMVKLTVSYATGGPAFESHRIGMFHRAAYLESSDGKRIPFADVNVVAAADGGIALEFRFANLTRPANDYRFVYEAPTMLLDAPVQVELKVPRQ